MHNIHYRGVRRLTIWEEPAKRVERLWELRSAHGAYHARPTAFFSPLPSFTAKLSANCCKYPSHANSRTSTVGLDSRTSQRSHFLALLRILG